MAAPIVPLPRNLILGTKGRDVIAVKRALSRAGYIKWGDFTPVWGTYARTALHNFQKDHGLKPAGYGVKTHNALRNTHRKGYTKQWAFGAYEIEIMHEVYEQLHVSPTVKIRSKIIQMARYLYGYRYSIGYAQVRPFPLLHLGATITGKGYRWDCSGNVTICYYAAGAKNPNRIGGVQSWHSGGEGYTGTLLYGGHKCDRLDLQPGDLVFYGFSRVDNAAFNIGDPTHVAIWEGDSAQDVYSFGSYPMRHAYYRYRHDVNCYVTYDITP